MANNKIMRLVVTAVVLTALMTLTAFAADITGGFGAIGGVDDTYYAAPATLNAAGNGLDLGEAIQLTTENNTGLAGLYAVSTDETVTIDDEIVYVYGDTTARGTLINTYAEGDIDPVSGNTVSSSLVGFMKIVGSWNKYAPGYWNGGGYWVKLYLSGSRHEITANGAQQFDSDYKKVWFYNNTWDEALAEAATLAEEDETALATYTATVDALYSPYFKADAHSEFIDEETQATYETEKTAFYNKVLGKTTNTADIKYAYTSEQIIPISEVNSFVIHTRVQRGVSGYSEAFSSKIIAFVYDPEIDEVVPHTGWTNAASMTNTFAGVARTVDFTDTENWTPAFPETGYLVGLRILPWAGMNDATKFRTNVGAVVNPATYNDSFQTGREGLWITDYSIDLPKAPKPEGIAIENGTLTGTVEGTTYEYAAVSSADMLNAYMNKNEVALSYTTVEDTTVFTDAGIYAVRVSAVEGKNNTSDAVLLFVSGTSVEQKEISNLVITETTAKIQTQATDDWVEGYWTGDAGTTIRTAATNGVPSAWPSNYCVTKSGAHVSGGDTVAIKAVNFKYSYDGNEIIPVNMLGSFGYRAFARSSTGTLADASPKSKFIIYVLNLDGTVSEYTAMSNCSYMNGVTDTVLASAFNLPSKGYIIGLECYPFYEFDEEKSTVTTAIFELMFDPSTYILRTEAQATPELTVETGANKTLAELKISNFVTGTTYAYSTDEGATWTEFTTATLKFTEANKYYWVKALGDATHFDSEIAVPNYPSAAAIYKGASLVLDGKIGIRIYFDVDKAALGYTMIKHTIANGVDSVEYAKDIQAVSYEADGRTAYVTAYVAPKDFDNATITVNQLLVNNSTVGISGSIINSIPVHTVSNYITAFYAQVEAGNAECIAAKDLVDALKAYCENADVYFNTEAAALDAVVADTTAINTIAYPAKSGKFTYNGETILEHYSTSLILEENVTVRHYFKWNTKIDGAPVLTSENVSVTVDNGKTATIDTTKNVKYPEGDVDYGYLYIDITDIDAKNLDTQYELTLTLDEESIVVKYSALNYVKQSYNDADSKLANLVKAIYNYSVEAESYAD